MYKVRMPCKSKSFNVSVDNSMFAIVYVDISFLTIVRTPLTLVYVAELWNFQVSRQCSAVLYHC